MSVALVESPGAIFEGSRAPWSDILLMEQHRLAGGKWHASEPRDYLIAMTLSARGELECRLVNQMGDSIDRTCGQGLFAVCSSAACWRPPSDTDVLFAAFDGAFIERVAHSRSAWKTSKIIETIGFTDPGIEIVLLALRTEIREGCPTGRLYGQSLAEALVARLFWLSSTQCTRSKHGLSPRRLRRVTEYVDANLSDDTSIARLSRLVQLSPRQFCRLFRESMGLSPHRYVLTRRIVASQNLLVESRLSLAEVSYAVGFPSQAHFTTTFTKRVGVTPSTYRKLCQLE